MALLHSRFVSLRLSDSLEYVSISLGDNLKFNADDHLIVLREYEDGFSFQHELTGHFLSGEFKWIPCTYKTAHRFNINYCRDNLVRYIQASNANTTSYTQNPSTLLVEERDEATCKLEPLGPFQTLSDKELAELDKQFDTGGSSLKPSQEEVMASKHMGTLFEFLSKLSDDEAEQQWIRMITDEGKRYQFVRHGEAKVIIWPLGEVSADAQESLSQIHEYQKEVVGDHSEPEEKNFCEFVVIYKSRGQTTFQKYLGYAESITRMLLVQQLTTSLVRLINYTCRRLASAAQRRVISRALAEGAEASMSNSKWYIRFWRFRTTSLAGRFLIGGMTNVAALIAVDLAVSFLFKLIKVPQLINISVYNRSKEPLQCIVSYLDNVEECYFPEDKDPNDTYIIKPMVKTGDVLPDPDLPGKIDENQNVVYFGRFEMMNDNKWFEGLGCLITIKTEKGDKFINYTRYLVPYGAENKIAIGTHHLSKSSKSIYDALAEGQKATIHLQSINEGFTIKQTISALTGDDHRYIGKLCIRG
ncbi:hypothetical protein ACODG7_04630 [Vibrio anguillarum]|uniref:hypothetical protein n=1 Tax=Vibrio anguillarum TaxID=55601 RepID=UPI0003133133|nr:hypothetical protein [Vibrio anguillarum]ASG09004.1 hypothetical protein CEQ50_15670 [Vibrio anguillarum]OEE40823.1 hypothetical protein A1QW_03660 [Vibrio anguillarum]OEF89214.1 hypothetical protein A1QY_04985 [Vibrio anguillarum]